MPPMAHPHRPLTRLRSAVFGAAVLAALAAPTTSSAHHDHHQADAAKTAPATAPASHSGHDMAAMSAAKPAAASAKPMFVIADPKNPRIARGPSGPLWSAHRLRAVGTTAMGMTFAQRDLAVLAFKNAVDPVATPSALTTAQATKKLTKKCQKLVKITKAKDLKKLKKADKKARTRCLEQRRKIIADSKKKPDTNTGAGSPGTTTPGTTTPGTTTPTNPNPTPNNPTPTTPTNPSPTTPTNPAPTGCTTAGTGSTLYVTAIGEGDQFELSACGLKAGALKFVLASEDQSEEHNLIVADGYNEITSGGQTTSTPKGTQWVTIPVIHPGGSAKESTPKTMPAGDYWLICIVEGHVGMATKFKVFA